MQGPNASLVALYEASKQLTASPDPGVQQLAGGVLAKLSALLQ